jgi:hypothetical protein
MTIVDARRRWEIFILRALIGGGVGAAIAAGAMVLMNRGVSPYATTCR